MNGWRSPHHPLQLVLGLLLWSGWFVLIYSTLSVGCGLSPQADGELKALLGATALPVLIASAWLGWRCLRAGRQRGQYGWQRFIALCGAGIHLIALLATLFVALPLLFLPPCL